MWRLCRAVLRPFKYYQLISKLRWKSNSRLLGICHDDGQSFELPHIRLQLKCHDVCGLWSVVNDQQSGSMTSQQAFRAFLTNINLTNFIKKLNKTTAYSHSVHPKSWEILHKPLSNQAEHFMLLTSQPRLDWSFSRTCGLKLLWKLAE